MHGRLSKDIPAVKFDSLAILTIDALKLNNAIKACLINETFIILNH